MLKKAFKKEPPATLPQFLHINLENGWQQWDVLWAFLKYHSTEFPDTTKLTILTITYMRLSETVMPKSALSRSAPVELHFAGKICKFIHPLRLASYGFRRQCIARQWGQSRGRLTLEREVCRQRQQGFLWETCIHSAWKWQQVRVISWSIQHKPNNIKTLWLELCLGICSNHWGWRSGLV